MFLIGGDAPIRLRITIQNDVAGFLPKVSSILLCTITEVVFVAAAAAAAEAVVVAGDVLVPLGGLLF